MSDHDGFQVHRQYLIGICYRMLGSVTDAEDTVQDAYLRWHSAGCPVLDSPEAWLKKVCVRLCLDRIRSAQKQPVSYPGQWLPEPMIDPPRDPQLDESLSMALLLAVQRLTPAERAVFILHDIFSHTFDEVAEILSFSPANCRQLAVRARRRLQHRPAKSEMPGEQVEQLTGSFFSALRTGDLDGLRALLTDDVRLVSDGGGRASAVAIPVSGREAVHRFLTRIFRAMARRSYELQSVRMNGGPAMLVLAAGQSPSLFQLEAEGGLVKAVYVQRNPDKLTRVVKYAVESRPPILEPEARV